MKEGYINPQSLVSETGYQSCVINYPEVSSEEIFLSVEKFYKKFYYRPKYVIKVLRKAFSDINEMKRIYREAREFYGFMAKRRETLKSC